ASRRLLVALAAAWLSFGAVGLVVLLVVHRQTGSYTVAGVAVGAFSIGSGVLAPVRGRRVDRRGGRRLLRPAGGRARGLRRLGGGGGKRRRATRASGRPAAGRQPPRQWRPAARARDLGRARGLARPRRGRRTRAGNEVRRRRVRRVSPRCVRARQHRR